MIDLLRRWVEAARELLHDMLLWVESFAATPYGTWALFLVAFAESSFFPIPPDVLLIALCLGDPSRSLWFALVCSIGSVLGGMAGYGIGLWGGRPLLLRMFHRRRVETVSAYFDRYNAWAVGIAGLTPIPYKVFTIAGGAFAIDFRVFVLASMVSRTLRFFVIAALIWWFGEPIRTFIEEHLGWLTIAFVVILLAGFWLVGRGSRGLWRDDEEDAEGDASDRAPRAAGQPARDGTGDEEETMDEPQTVTRAYRLAGRVQGVGFRTFIRREAERLGIAGWARNAPDGTVEVEAGGPPDAVAAFEERLRQGPPASRVDDLDARELDTSPSGDGFEIRV